MMSETEGESNQLVDLMKDMFIFQLLQAQVPQQTVGRIVRVDVRRVNRIGKLLNRSKKAKNAGGEN
jgi:hypothetical protein